MNNISWNLIRSFLAAADTGSLSAAARSLGVSQPTLSRDIQALEQTTQLNLFQRSTQGLKLTPEGQRLVETAQAMSHAAQGFERKVFGASADIQGEVRISVNDIVGTYLLPAALAEFHRHHPQIQVEITISNQVASLSKREADIALRMFRPKQPNLVVRRLPDLPLGFYAHPSYLAQQGEPQNLEELFQHSVIGFDEAGDFIEGAAQMGYQISRQQFALRTDHLPSQIQLARAAAGIVATHIGIGDQYSDLVRILKGVQLPPLEFWVVCHQDAQHNLRISTLRNHLISWLEDDPYANCIL